MQLPRLMPLDSPPPERMTDAIDDSSPRLPTALRPLVLCSPDSEYANLLTTLAKQVGLRTVVCSEVTQLTLAVADATPDCLIFEGPDDFVNRALMYCEMLDVPETTILVSAAPGHFALDVPAKCTHSIEIVPKHLRPDAWKTLLYRIASMHALERTAKQHLARHRRAIAKLTDAQRGVLEDVCRGKLNKRIANEQGVSLRTIEQRRRRVFDVLGVASAAPLGFEVGFAAAMDMLIDAIDARQID